MNKQVSTLQYIQGLDGASLDVLISLMQNYDPAWYAGLSAPNKVIVDGIKAQGIILAAIPTVDYAVLDKSGWDESDVQTASTDPSFTAWVKTNP